MASISADTEYERPLSAAINGLNDRVSDLDNSVDMLRERIAPILSSFPEDTKGPVLDHVEKGSDLMRDLELLHRRLVTLHQALNDLFQSVDI